MSNVEKWLFQVNNITIKHFIVFLKANNALNSYLINLNKKENHYKSYALFKRDTMSSIILYFDAPRLIDLAFNWSETDEGIDYWEKLSSKWIELHSKILKKYSLAA